MKLLEEKNDPFEFIRYEWRELLITDPEEQAEFAKYCERKDNLDLRLDDFQVDAIRSVFDGKHTQVRLSGGTKLGKGFSIGGLVVNIWFDRYPDCKIILVGPNNGHVRDNLFGEASKWRRMMTSFKSGLCTPEVQKEKIEEQGNEMHFIKIVNTESGEGMSGYHCHSEDTEVMTDSGWKLFSELSGAERLLTMDPISKNCIWEKPTAVHAYRHEGEMYECNERYADFCVTPNHRMLIQSVKMKKPVFLEARDFFDGGISQNNRWTHAGVDFDCEDVESYVIPEFESAHKKYCSRVVSMDQWCDFAGWVASEGHVKVLDGVASSVTVGQKKSENFELIRDAMRPFGNVTETCGEEGLVSFTITSRQIAAHVADKIGVGSFHVRVPEEIFKVSPRQMKIFLKSHLLGDGYVRKNCTRNKKEDREVHYSCSPELTSGIHALRTLIGQYASVNRHYEVGHTSEIDGMEVVSNYGMNAVYCGKSPPKFWWRNKKVKKKKYKGMVYCATVPTFGTLLTRRNGKCFWSGNSYDRVTGVPVTLICIDESSGCPEKYYTDALSQTRMLIAISNPRAPSGWFYNGFASARGFISGCATQNSSSGPMRLISVGGIHCVNVRAKRLANLIGPPKGIHINGREFRQGEPIPESFFKYVKPLIPGQMTLDKFQELEETRDREWRAYGRFPKSGTEFDLFGYDWKEIHKTQYALRDEKVRCRAIGFDVGRSKLGDPSCLAFGDEHGLKELYLEHIKNQMDLQGWVWKVANDRGMNIYDGEVPIAIDYVGVGAGIADSLEAEGAFVIKIEGAAERDKLQYFNRRTEIYGELANAMDPTANKEPWIVPVDTFTDPWLWDELMAHERIFTRKAGQYRLNDKRRKPANKAEPLPDNRTPVEEKINRSPDRSDAVAYLFQAVRELPEYGDNLQRQFDPAAEIKETYVDRQTKMVQVLFWSGKKETLRQEEFEERFGKNVRIFGVSDWAAEVVASVS